MRGSTRWASSFLAEADEKAGSANALVCIARSTEAQHRDHVVDRPF
jgi:hypothetical protein